MALGQALCGVSGILVTPFDESGAIDAPRLVPVIDRAITAGVDILTVNGNTCLLYTSPSPRDLSTSRMPSSA